MNPTEHARVLDVIARLLAIERNDPAYRDLYRRRARALLEDVLPSAEQASLRALERLLRDSHGQTREAVLRGDWPRVRQLVGSIVSARHALEAKRTEIELANRVHHGDDLPVDPFSPGLTMLIPGRPDTVALLAIVREQLAALEGLDPGGAALYAARRRYFDALQVARHIPGQPAASLDSRQAVIEGLEDLRRGEIEELGRLAQRMLARPDAMTGGGGSPLPDRLGVATRLAAPFPPEAVRRGRALGLAAVTLPAEPEVADYVHRVAWMPDFVRPDLRRDGEARLEAARADPVLAAFREPARETLSLFALHVYLNSAGARYLPRPVEEVVLVEDFPESERPFPRSPLLDALDLPGRHGLARVEVETALSSVAPDLLEAELGLDPIHYQMLCVPSDVYNRAGAAYAWGRSALWTHFDGYQLMSVGHLRALVGGNVRYGGRADFVSIARDDARENVVIRLAVVRRERLLGSWG